MIKKILRSAKIQSNSTPLRQQGIDESATITSIYLSTQEYCTILASILSSFLAICWNKH